jgi:purine-binding chemotaxis protein CheW
MAGSTADRPGAAQPYVLFDLAGTTYALPSSQIQQVEMVEKLTPVPKAPPSVAGVVLSRGQVIPALDLRVRFGLPPQAYTLHTRLLVVSHADRTVGLIVDTAREFAAIPGEAIRPPPEAIGDLSGEYLQAIAMLGARLVLILDVGAILEQPDSVLQPPGAGQRVDSAAADASVATTAAGN